MNVRALLRLRYDPQEWALVFEVEVHGGRDRGGVRYVDAMALNLWHSRGFELHGFEIKTNRGDWLRELKQPSKADAAFRYCDRWFVISTEGVVKLDEVPEPWGWIEIKGERMFTRKASPKNSPEPWPRKLIASMMRRTARVENDEIDALVRARLAPMEARLRDDVAQSRRVLDEQQRVFEQKVAEIAKATGVDLHAWKPAERIVKAMRIVSDSHLFVDGYDGLEQIAKRLRDKADHVDEIIKELRA